MAVTARSPLPTLSFNPKITAPEDAVWFDPPTEEALEQMKQQDPQLQSTWSVWEQHVQPKEKEKKGDYADATKSTVDFATVKEFWSVWNHLPQPSELLDGKKWMRESGDSRTIVDCLMVFKKGIKPEWEDPVNAKGGHFQVQFKGGLGGALVDEIWNSVVLAMIGGALEPADMVTGVRMVDKLNQKIRPALRLELWFGEMESDEKVQKLKKSFEQVMTTNLDGTLRQITWGATETKPHGDTHKAHPEVRLGPQGGSKK
jgi:translation initiation factor 4E